MKKKLIGLVAVILLFAVLATGCMNSGGSSLITPEKTWTFYDKGITSETVEYTVKVDENFNYSSYYDKDMPRIKGTGKYASTISWTDANKGFDIKTTFTFNGHYEKDGYKSEAFEDVITTEASMLSSTDSFYPVSSKVTSKTTKVVTDGKGNYKTIIYDVQETYAYDKSKDTLVATLNAIDEKGNYTKPAKEVLNYDENAETKTKKQVYNYKKISKKGKQLIFDNQTLFYTLRGVSELSGTTKNAIAFNSPNVMLSKSIYNAAAQETNNEKEGFENPKHLVNGKEVNEECNLVYFSLQGSTSTIKMFVSNKKYMVGDEQEKKERQPRQIIKMQQQMMIYELEKVNGKFITD